MKAINSKERSKQVWQFIFSCVGLVGIPVALIFFSFYQAPAKLSEREERILKEYSDNHQNNSSMFTTIKQLDNILNEYCSNPNSNKIKFTNDYSKLITTLPDDSVNNKLLFEIKQGLYSHQTHADSLRFYRSNYYWYKDRADNLLKEVQSSNAQLAQTLANQLPPNE